MTSRFYSKLRIFSSNNGNSLDNNCGKPTDKCSGLTSETVAQGRGWNNKSYRKTGRGATRGPTGDRMNISCGRELSGIPSLICLPEGVDWRVDDNNSSLSKRSKPLAFQRALAQLQVVRRTRV